MCFISRCIPCLPCFDTYHQQSTVSPSEESAEQLTYYPVPSSPPRSFQTEQQPSPTDDEEHLTHPPGSYSTRGGHSPSGHSFCDL